ncbi:cache domain-containing sensor histidine kinase [Paenibacillus sp. strain BS8-2]
MNPRLSFQAKLFIMYSLLITLIIATAFSAFYWYYKKVNVDALIHTYQREANSISQQLDNSVYTMDRLVMQIKHNPTVANKMYYVPFEPNPESYFDNNPEDAYILKDIVSSIVGVDPQFYYRVSLISKSGAFLSVGAYSDRQITARRTKELDWFQLLSDESAYRLLLPPHKDDWDHNNNYVVSVVRKIGDNTNVQALVEIQIPYEFIEKVSLQDPAASGLDKKVMVMSSTGEVVFPLQRAEQEDEDPLSPYRNVYLNELHESEEGYAYVTMPGGKKELIVHQRAEYADWIVMIAQPQEAFLQPTRQAGYLFILLALLIVTLTLLTFYFSTKKLVKPLRQLRDTMSMVNLNSMHDAQEHHLFAGADLHNSHNEVHHLYKSFRHMLARLEESKELAIQSHSRELQSHFVALQAQINPHFLYNTLSLIGMMGHETGNANIMNLSSMLVNMFRYITYSNGQPVTLKEELNHTENYLNIMKFRYADHFEPVIDIKGPILDSLLPKITLQPFVENCFKHGFINKRYPWKIAITSYEELDFQIVEISDDGSGFTADFLERFKQQREDVVKGKLVYEKEEQSGSGVMNTYARLYYYFGENLLFELGNHENGGAYIRIGWRNDTTNIVGGL